MIELKDAVEIGAVLGERGDHEVAAILGQLADDPDRVAPQLSPVQKIVLRCLPQRDLPVIVPSRDRLRDKNILRTPRFPLMTENGWKMVDAVIVGAGGSGSAVDAEPGKPLQDLLV